MRKNTTFLRPQPGLGKQLKVWDQIPCAHFIAHLYKKLTKGKRFISNHSRTFPCYVEEKDARKQTCILKTKSDYNLKDKFQK